VVKRSKVPDVVVLVDLEPQVRKTPAGEFDLPRAEIDTDAEARRHGLQEIGRKAADLEHPLAGRYNKPKKSKNLVVIVCVPGYVVSSVLAYSLVMFPDFSDPAFQGCGTEPAGGRGLGDRGLI
jgi:hypothetical protein